MENQIPYNPAGIKDDNDNKHKEYQPTDQELKLIKKISAKFDENKKYRERFDNKWADYYKMFRGKQWLDGKRPSYLHSEVINLVFQVIQSQVPILTDSKPRFEYLPQDPTDMELSEILNQVTAWDWARNNWLMTLTEVIYDAHIFGTGLSDVNYDPLMDDGLGRITYESDDIFYIFPDKEARDTNKRNRQFFKAKPTCLSEIKRKYPDKGKFVKSDVASFNSLDRSNLSDIKITSPSQKNVFYEGDAYQNQDSKNQAILYECYYYDDELEDVEVTSVDDETQQEIVETVKRLKYPGGRYVAYANNIVLEDTNNKIEEGFIPYQRFINYIDPRNFWGISEIEQIEGPQKIFNKLVSFALDVVMLMGNPIWIVDTSADIDTDNLTNAPGLIVEKTPGSEVRRESGAQLQPYVLQIIEKIKEWIDQVSGSQDITRGVRPEGVTAASAISQLQNAAQTRLRLKNRNLDDYLQTLGQHYLALVFQYYTIPQIIRVTNKNEPGLEDYFKFHIDNSGEKPVAHIRPYKYNDVDNRYYELEERILAINKKFDVVVSTGSSMPFARVEKENRVFSLYDRGIIDAEEVLKALDYPNFEKILARAQEKAQMQSGMSGQQTQQTAMAPQQL